MKTLFLILAVSAAAFGQMKHERKFAERPPEKQYFTNYDKYKDVTTVSTPVFTVNGANGKMIMGSGIQLVLRYAGKTLGNEKQFHLEISSMSARGERITRAREIIALVDG